MTTRDVPAEILLNFPAECRLLIELGTKAGNNIVSMAEDLHGLAGIEQGAQAFVCALSIEAVLSGVALHTTAQKLTDSQARKLARKRLADMAAHFIHAADDLAARSAAN